MSKKGQKRYHLKNTIDYFVKLVMREVLYHLKVEWYSFVEFDFKNLRTTK